MSYLNRKHELQQVRKWIKNLPTYSMPLTDAAWQVLDVPVINEIEKSVKAFYAVKFYSFKYFMVLNFYLLETSS